FPRMSGVLSSSTPQFQTVSPPAFKRGFSGGGRCKVLTDQCRPLFKHQFENRSRITSSEFAVVPVLRSVRVRRREAVSRFTHRKPLRPFDMALSIPGARNLVELSFRESTIRFFSRSKVLSVLLA